MAIWQRNKGRDAPLATLDEAAPGDAPETQDSADEDGGHYSVLRGEPVDDAEPMPDEVPDATPDEMPDATPDATIADVEQPATPARARRRVLRRRRNDDADAVPVVAPDTESTVEPEPEPEPAEEPAVEADDRGEFVDSGNDPGSDVDVAERDRRSLRLRVGDSAPVTLFLAAHPKQAVVTAAAVAVAALASGRATREVVVVAATVLVGQTVLGWHNDIVDRARDARHGTARKPIARGALDPATAWFAVVVGVLLVVPLSIATGLTAGGYYLGALVVGALGNVALRRGRFSALSWAASFALLVPYLSFGGFGGSAEGDPPQPVMIVLAALLGVGVHVVRSIWGLVADDQDGWQTVPLRLGRRMGATRLLVLAGVYLVVVVGAIAIVGATVGLRQ